MKNVYRFADVKIEIRSVFSSVHEMCRGYAVDGIPQILISTTMRDIELERQGTRNNGLDWQDDYLETLAVIAPIGCH